jgi:two-component system LytT family response regulator
MKPWPRSFCRPSWCTVIRVLLVDDENAAIERLKKLLKPYKEIDVIGECMDGLTALSAISDKKPDLVFLDIDMPELSGLEVAKTLGTEGPLIVFATAYDEYALAAFESNAIDYVVKPVSVSRLDFTIEKVRKSLASKTKTDLQTTLTLLQSTRNPLKLAVRIGAKFEVFDPRNIALVLAKDHYTSLMVDGREFLSDDSLEALNTRLDPNIFIRVHRGAIINILFLKELRREGDRKFTAVLTDKANTEVLVSRDRLPKLKTLLGLD